MTSVDRCKGCRATYNAIVRAIASNNIISILFAGIPNYILITLSASQFTYYVHSIFASASYTILAVLLLAWILAIISALRVYPNLLSVSIFIYKCLAHWSLVSLVIVVFYGWTYVALGVMGSLLGTLFPLILSLYVCGDVLERVRQRLFGVIEQTATATATVDASFSAAGGMAKEGV
jgi:prepilin signal peptidase PulO-like enzyme (type II secretory pathway)